MLKLLPLMRSTGAVTTEPVEAQPVLGGGDDRGRSQPVGAKVAPPTPSGHLVWQREEERVRREEGGEAVRTRAGREAKSSLSSRAGIRPTHSSTAEVGPTRREPASRAAFARWPEREAVMMSGVSGGGSEGGCG